MLICTVAGFHAVFARMAQSATLVACTKSCSFPGKNMDEQRGMDVYPSLRLQQLPTSYAGEKGKGRPHITQTGRPPVNSPCAAHPDPRPCVVFSDRFDGQRLRPGTGDPLLTNPPKETSGRLYQHAALVVQSLLSLSLAWPPKTPQGAGMIFMMLTGTTYLTILGWRVVRGCPASRVGWNVCYSWTSSLQARPSGRKAKSAAPGGCHQYT